MNSNMGGSESAPLLFSKGKRQRGSFGQGVRPSLDMTYKESSFKSRENLLEERSKMFRSSPRLFNSSSRIDSIDSYRVPLRSAASDSGMGYKKRSYCVTDDEVSLLTPVDMGRQELYDIIPFTATHGLQKKQKGLSRAFAYYLSNLSLVEKEQDMRAIYTEKDRECCSSYTSLLLLDELEMDQVLLTTPLIYATLVACLSQFLVGFNTGVLNLPEKTVFENHGTIAWAAAVAGFAGGGSFGIGLGGYFPDIGRRRSLLFDTWLFFFGGLIQVFALDMYSIIIGRLIIGFASGLVSILVPLYLGELAPPTLRGALGSLIQVSFVLGIMFSYLLGLLLTPKWRIIFAVTPLTCVIQLAVFSFIVESPMWLLNRDNNSKRARFIIKSLRECINDYEIETEAKLFISAGKAQNLEKNRDKQSVLLEMYKDDKLFFFLISSIILQLAQQLCGINAIFYYSTLFFESFEGLTDDPLMSTAILGSVNVISTMLAALLMDSFGRRTLLMWSSGGMLLSCTLIVMSLGGYFSNVITVFACNAYVFFFAIGLGPIPCLIVAEIFDAKYVSTAMSIAIQLNWASNFAVGFAFPFMIDYLQEYAFGPFAIVLLFTFLFVMFYLPETQGTTPEELMETLVKKNYEKIYHNLNVEEQYQSSTDIEWRRAMEQVKEEE